MNSRTLQNPTLNFRLCLTLIAVWSCVFLSNNVYGQCWMHTPTEYGKNLEEHMIKDPVHRWYNTEMDFRVQNTVRYWYGGDIAIAKSQWNNSSYKGVSTSFDFNDLGNTNAPSDYSDLNNVIGILHLPSDIAAQAHNMVV